MAKSSLTIGDLIYRLGLSGEEELIAGLDKVLNQADKKIGKDSEETGKKGGRAAGKGFSDQFKATFSGAALGSFIGTALSQAFTGAVAATTRFVSDSLNEYKVYEQGLLQLKLAGETNLADLSKRIHEVARASKVFSATDVSLAVGDLVKAGYDAETAFALVETGVLGAASEVDAATGTFGDLGNTAVQLGNILRALGYDVSQSGRVMDVMARAAQDSNLDVSDLVDIISRVGPTAKLAGLEIEDLAAMAAVLSNNGMDASLIGTGLRSVLQSLINPSAQVKGELDKLGISLVDGQGNLRDFNDVLDGLHELTQRGGEGLQLLTQATGSYGSTAASSLGTASEAVKEFRTNMENAEGSAQTLADTMRNSAAGSAAEYAARMADARAELGERMMPLMITMYETILPAMVTGLGWLIEKWEQWYFLLTGTTTAIQQAEAAMANQVRSGLGEERGQALLDLRRAELAVAEAEQRLADVALPWGWDKWRAEQALEAARADLAVAQERFDVLQAQYELEQQRQRNLADWDAGTQFGPQAMPEGWTPQQVNELAAAYRNLAAIQADLSAAQEELAAAGSDEQARAIQARITSLKAEEAAYKARIGLIEQTTTAQREAAKTDPLVDEAQRVQADLQRLKLAHEQGTLSTRDYVAAQEAHLRRLDGLYERAGSPAQSLAVLRARKAFLDELARLEADADRQMAAIRAVNRDREEEDRYPSTVTGANLRARIRANAMAEAAAEAAARQEAWETVIQPALAKLQEQREAFEAGERPSGGSLTPAQIQQLQRRIANREAFLAKAEAEAAAEARRVAWETIVQPALAKIQAQRAAFEAGERPSGGSLTPAELQQLRRRMQNRADAQAAAEAQAAELDRALGGTVRLTQAQRSLGQSTRDDVISAVEEQIALLERLLPATEEGSERWYQYVAALEAAKTTLDALNKEVPEFAVPDIGTPEKLKRAVSEVETLLSGMQARLTTETDESVLALLNTRIMQYTALLAELRQALGQSEKAEANREDREEAEESAKQLASEVMNVAASFPKALAAGIRDGDIGGALKGALGGAADFFLDKMLESILGPITEELTAAITKSITTKAAGGAAGAAGGLGALGPTGLVLGGVALLASMLVGAGKQRQSAAERNQQSVRAAVSGAPSVTYNLTGNVTVNSNAAWSDPTFTARWRSETEALLVSLLGKVRR